MSDAERLERLLAKEEIREVVYRWCRAVDRCDWAEVHEVFHPDGHDSHGIFQGGVDDLVAWLRERHKSISRSMHLVTNIFLEFADADNALAESYSIALQYYPGGGAAETRSAIAGGGDVSDGDFNMLVTGRYVDHFQRRDGRWRILNRSVVFDNSVMLAAGGKDAQLGADWIVSTRDSSDPLFALRRQVGLG